MRVDTVVMCVRSRFFSACASRQGPPYLRGFMPVSKWPADTRLPSNTLNPHTLLPRGCMRRSPVTHTGAGLAAASTTPTTAIS